MGDLYIKKFRFCYILQKKTNWFIVMDFKEILKRQFIMYKNEYMQSWLYNKEIKSWNLGWYIHQKTLLSRCFIVFDININRFIGEILLKNKFARVKGYVKLKPKVFWQKNLNIGFSSATKVYSPRKIIIEML